MGDYADAGYRLQHYKITFYADNNGKIPLKVVRRHLSITRLQSVISLMCQMLLWSALESQTMQISSLI